ncbi:MAG: pirin family protein [Bacteroidia bacterium]
MEKVIIHKAETRGHASHGWLNAHHTFSFASYHDDERVHFGELRVLNDDIIAGGMGFGTHPHDNMEIITIPLSGDLEHKDSMGNSSVIKTGDVQVMSAGTGIQHSEKNHNKDKEVKLLQIWVFPNKQNVTPRYGQISFNPAERKNKWQQIISPNESDAGLWIHQNAWFYLTDLDAGKELTHKLNLTTNGVYIFVMEGDLTVNSNPLEKRDGIGITGAETITLKANSNAEVLLMELPMR